MGRKGRGRQRRGWRNENGAGAGGGRPEYLQGHVNTANSRKLPPVWEWNGCTLEEEKLYRDCTPCRIQSKAVESGRKSPAVLRRGKNTTPRKCSP